MFLFIFSTYDELSFYPGDNLNIIIGPNGTGKSTIVAGIIIACGGDPALLSRSKNVSFKSSSPAGRFKLFVCSSPTM